MSETAPNPICDILTALARWHRFKLKRAWFPGTRRFHRDIAESLDEIVATIAPTSRANGPEGEGR